MGAMVLKITETLSCKKQTKTAPKFLINIITVSSIGYAFICQFL